MAVCSILEDELGGRGEKLYVSASELLNEIALNAASGVSPWGEFNLPNLVSEQAEALELPLDLAARKVHHRGGAQGLWLALATVAGLHKNG